MSVDYELKRQAYLKNYLEVAKRVKEIVQRHDAAEVYVFGSVIEGKATAMSDIDILVISERKDLEYPIKIDVYKSIDAPIEIHFVTRKEYADWYSRFIEKKIQV